MRHIASPLQYHGLSVLLFQIKHLRFRIVGSLPLSHWVCGEEMAYICDQILQLLQMKEDCRCANSYYASKPQLKLQSQTTNQATYKAHPISKQPELQPPKVTQKHYDPEALKTSYKNTFTAPPPTASHNEQVDSLALHMRNKPKNVPFYSETSYKQNFPRHEVKLQKQPTYEYKPKQTKFEGETSYKTEFGAKRNADLQSSQPLSTLQDYMGRKAKVPFEGRTSYQDTFTKHDVKPEKQPEYRYQPKGTKFEGQSSYKETFQQLPRSAYGSGTDYCPVHPDKVAIK